MTIPYAELRRKWKTDPEFGKQLEALRSEFQLARALTEARARVGLRPFVRPAGARSRAPWRSTR